MSKRAETLGLILLLLLSVLVSWGYSVSADYTFDDSNMFQVGNENYTFPATGMTFSEVVTDFTNWIRFNQTDINISSSNPINLSLTYLSDTIDSAAYGEKVLSFDANATGGSVSFSIGGFPSGMDYTVKRDGSIIANVAADNEGIITFDNAVWSDHTFDVFRKLEAGTNNAFLINDTDGDQDFSDFIFTEKEYYSLTFYFRVNTSHNITRVFLKDAVNNSLCWYNITNSSVSFNGTGFNQVINNNTWYKLETVFNWDSDTITGKLFSSSSLLNSGSVNMGNYSGLGILNFTGVTGAKAFLYVDNIQLYRYGSAGSVMRDHAFEAIASGFKGLADTGSMLPLIVLGVVIFLILSLVFGIAFLSGSNTNKGSDQAL